VSGRTCPSRRDHRRGQAWPAAIAGIVLPEMRHRIRAASAAGRTAHRDRHGATAARCASIAHSVGFPAAPSNRVQPGPCVQPIIRIDKLGKTYASGFQALKSIDLEIHRGEIFALLGPNGAGKTTLISIVCGIVNASSGTVTADGHDIVRDFRAARAKIGLVPQELSTDAFETVWATVRFSRGLYGKPPDPAHLEKVLRDLSLWDKRDSRIMALSGGMKRRVLIAKALAHEPRILFLDEPTAGVDVELRHDMWQMVRRLRENGVTIILTTHYIEEAEEMADRIGVIHKGELILVEDKAALMRKLGKKQLTLQLQEPIAAIPEALAGLPLELSEGGNALVYTFDAQGEATGIAPLLRRLAEHGIDFKDLHSSESSLEDIFVSLVRGKA
jgi:ABC-2 type transport system ATP-binding protein